MVLTNSQKQTLHRKRTYLRSRFYRDVEELLEMYLRYPRLLESSDICTETVSILIKRLKLLQDQIEEVTL